MPQDIANHKNARTGTWYYRTVAGELAAEKHSNFVYKWAYDSIIF